MSDVEAPLAAYRIVGYRERWFKAAPEAPAVPAGACWHCGTAIALCVHIRHAGTGETHEIGIVCAEKVGLDAAELARIKGARRAELAAQRELRHHEWRRRQGEEREAELAGRIGRHGTESRGAASRSRAPRPEAEPGLAADRPLAEKLAGLSGRRRGDADGCGSLPPTICAGDTLPPLRRLPAADARRSGRRLPGSSRGGATPGRAGSGTCVRSPWGTSIVTATC